MDLKETVVLFGDVEEWKKKKGRRGNQRFRVDIISFLKGARGEYRRKKRQSCLGPKFYYQRVSGADSIDLPTLFLGLSVGRKAWAFSSFFSILCNAIFSLPKKS